MRTHALITGIVMFLATGTAHAQVAYWNCPGDVKVEWSKEKENNIKVTGLRNNQQFTISTRTWDVRLNGERCKAEDFGRPSNR